MAAVVAKSSDNDMKASSKSSKRVTRSSIRNTLNLASVGKALADVMGKDGKDKDKDIGRRSTDSRRDTGRRPSTSSLSSKESVSRRTSTIGANKTTSFLEPVIETTQSKKYISPDQKTVTQLRKTSLQRAGRSSVDETGARVTPTSSISPQSSVLGSRTTTLRPRKGPSSGSALPKYRPRSVIVEGSSKETLSAIRIGARKRSNSDEEKDSSNLDNESTSVDVHYTIMEKREKMTSPKPRRLRKAMESSSSGLDSSASSPPRKSKESFVASLTSTPPRKKAQKSSGSPVVTRSSLPRPSPRDSPRTSADSPRTPSSLKNIASRYLNGRSNGRDSPSPLKSSPTANGSPVTRKSGMRKPISPTNCSESNQNTPIAPITRGISSEAGNDSIDDIELMLASVASSTAPTPAIPRINRSNFLLPQRPETPNKFLSTSQRSTLGLSHTSFNLSSDITSSPSRRLSPDRRPTALRSSIAAWQALADLSVEINADEMKGGLIKELDLPSTPAMLSPSPSMLIIDSEHEGLESPTPLSLPSPGGYTSISQVLLPGVTPSPAPALQLRSSSFYSDRRDPEMMEMDSATVTLLKLQLASVENIAKERLAQVTKLEEQLHTLKERRKRDERELIMHVNELEERLRETLAQRDREKDRERAPSRLAHANSGSIVDGPDIHVECRELLDEHIRAAEEERDDAVSRAVSDLAERERAERKRLQHGFEHSHKLSLVAGDARHYWNNVREVADAELETVRSNRQTLAVLRAGLDFFEAQFYISRCIRIPPPSAARFHLI